MIDMVDGNIALISPAFPVDSAPRNFLMEERTRVRFALLIVRRRSL